MLSVYATDYNSVNHMNIADTDIEEFYGSRQLSIFDFDNLQEFDLAGVKGRLESSSYVPKPGTKGHLALMEVVDDLFRRYQQDGKLSIDYNTRLYLARPSSVG
ncbi:MAG: hypothetical protein GY770_04390 [Aestuariibacter sp.]|nr:hypothetical protein [Aestuariibacter sp.]